MQKNVTEKCFYDILQYKFNDLIWFKWQKEEIFINGTTKYLFGTAECL